MQDKVTEDPHLALGYLGVAGPWWMTYSDYLLLTRPDTQLNIAVQATWNYLEALVKRDNKLARRETEETFQALVRSGGIAEDIDRFMYRLRYRDHVDEYAEFRRTFSALLKANYPLDTFITQLHAIGGPTPPPSQYHKSRLIRDSERKIHSR